MVKKNLNLQKKLYRSSLAAHGQENDSKIFVSSKAVLLLWIIYVISVLCLSCFCARLFIDAFWSPAGKGLTPWLSFVMSNCEVVTFPLV